MIWRGNTDGDVRLRRAGAPSDHAHSPDRTVYPRGRDELNLSSRGATEMPRPLEWSSRGRRRRANPRNTAATDPNASGWHTGPARQFVITLSGNSEVEVSGGVHVAAGPGHINLIEDTTGKGHVTRNFGPEDRIALTIPLADGVVIEGVKKARTQ